MNLCFVIFIQKFYGILEDKRKGRTTPTKVKVSPKKNDILYYIRKVLIMERAFKGVWIPKKFGYQKN